jgi:hypothetical protein
MNAHRFIKSHINKIITVNATSVEPDWAIIKEHTTVENILINFSDCRKVCCHKTEKHLRMHFTD